MVTVAFPILSREPWDFKLVHDGVYYPRQYKQDQIIDDEE